MNKAEELLYHPVEIWLRDLLKKSNAGPLFVGVNAPQGGGKTTLCRILVERFTAQGYKACSISVDDFYLTRAQQQRLALENPRNTYLQQRGYPGTHDISLGSEVLQRLRSLKAGEQIKIPRYDKSAFSGAGDRSPEDQWTQVSGPLDLIFLEGWFLGFQSHPPVEDHALEVCDQKLEEYTRWTRNLNAFVYLQAEDIEYVVNWRVEAEEQMKKQGKEGMSREQTRAYIEKFLPAYRLWSDTVNSRSLNVNEFYHRRIGQDRLPIAQTAGHLH